jgi:hypothetical protein
LQKNHQEEKKGSNLVEVEKKASAKEDDPVVKPTNTSKELPIKSNSIR